MKLTFHEADILAWFLDEQRQAFAKCAQEFDGYTRRECDEMVDSIREKVLHHLFNDLTTPAQ